MGIDKGNTAESEGWGQGQPAVRIMGRDVRVMKRWGYNPQEGGSPVLLKTEDTVDESQSTIKGEEDENELEKDDEPALWGLDLEALRSSNESGNLHGTASTRLPIYTPESARHYLLKSFASMSSHEAPSSASPKKKPTAAVLVAEKERNLALLLQALDMLYSSWAHVLNTEELDRRAWSWYVSVRPDVEHGVAGWGGKGEVKLSKILDLRRKG